MITKEWKPHKKQEQFIKIPHSVFEGFYGGSAGAGKSELLLMLPLIYGWFRRAGFKGLIVRRTFQELESEIILRSKEFYRYTGATYNEQKKRWTWEWPDGEAYIQFGHAQHEEDIRKYDTAEYNYIGFDELTSFTEFQYQYLAFSRCRSSIPGLPAIVRGASNPGNVGHGWVRKRFVEPAPSGGVLIVDKLTGLKRIFVQALPTDNPYLIENQPTYIAQLEMLPEAEKRAKLYGDWFTFTGQVFDEWRVQPFEDEPEHARHIVPWFEIPNWWPRIAAIDWGHSAATWIGWAAVSPNKRIYGYREYCEKGKKVDEWATEFARLSEGEDIRLVTMCHSAWQERGQGTIADLFTSFSGYHPARSSRDRVGGKMRMHEYLRWKPKPVIKLPKSDYNQELAGRILRNKGTKSYNEYLDLFKPEEPENNLPKLQVLEGTMPEFCRAIPLCVYDKTNKEDVAEFEGDDPYDGSRYLLEGAEAYVRDCEHEFVERQKVDVIIKNLEQTQDQTAFYMRMRNLEAKGKSKGIGISRHRTRGYRR